MTQCLTRGAWYQAELSGLTLDRTPAKLLVWMVPCGKKSRQLSCIVTVLIISRNGSDLLSTGQMRKQ